MGSGNAAEERKDQVPTNSDGRRKNMTTIGGMGIRGEGSIHKDGRWGVGSGR